MKNYFHCLRKKCTKEEKKGQRRSGLDHYSMTIQGQILSERGTQVMGVQEYFLSS